jgi:perosamine synthetase
LKKIPNLNYGQHLVEQDDIDAVVSVLKGDLITQGPVVEQFEQAIANKVKAKHAIAVTSGTAALHLACLAADVKPGSFGLTSAMTFVASANSMLYCGMSIGLVDIESDSLCMSPHALKATLTRHPDTKIIIPVHFGGLAGHSKKIRRLAEDRIIIEDAAHSLGADYACGQPVGCGAYADMTVFSLHPVKPITTGEGGIVVTNDSNLAHRLKVLRTHGIEREFDLLENTEEAFEDEQERTWYYEQKYLGYNYRLTDIQAALGLSQLNKLDRFITRRRDIAQSYDTAFKRFKNISRPQLAKKYSKISGHHIYILEFDLKKLKLSRLDLINQLSAHNIGSQVHYIPVYKHPYHSNLLGLTGQDFPLTERYYQGCLSIPIYPAMADQDVLDVIKAVSEVTGNKSLCGQVSPR